MKKRKFLLVFILGASIIIMGILAVVSVKSLFAELSASSLKHGGYRLPFANSPLDKYDFTNCKVGIHGYGGKIYELTDKQNDNFFELLFMLDINKYGLSEVPEYSGTPVSYEVKLKSGESLIIHHVGGPYLVIGDKAYKCYSERVLNKLDQLGNEAYKDNYPNSN